MEAEFTRPKLFATSFYDMFHKFVDVVVKFLVCQAPCVIITIDNGQPWSVFYTGCPKKVHNSA